MAKVYAEEQIWTDKPHNFLGLSLNFTRYILTPKVLITRQGFFNIKEDNIKLYRVTDMHIQLPLSQRIFGCGTVCIKARDSDTPEKVIKAVKNPRIFMQKLDAAIDAYREQTGVIGKEMYGMHGMHGMHGMLGQNSMSDDCNSFDEVEAGEV